MPLLKISFMSKIIFFLVAAMFSLSAMDLNFNQTQRLTNQGDAEAQFNLIKNSLSLKTKLDSKVFAFNF